MKLEFVSLSWNQINWSTTHKYKPVNDKTYEWRSKCNNLKIVLQDLFKGIANKKNLFIIHLREKYSEQTICIMRSQTYL